jgi:hypothetical protein
MPFMALGRGRGRKEEEVLEGWCRDVYESQVGVQVVGFQGGVR